MTFTDQQKTLVRFYLGYQDLFRDINTSLESQLSPNALSDPAATLVNQICTQLVSIDAELLAAHKRLKASKVGSINLNSNEMDQLKDEGSRFVARLASIFGLQPLRDMYRDEGASGGIIQLG